MQDCFREPPEAPGGSQLRGTIKDVAWPFTVAINNKISLEQAQATWGPCIPEPLRIIQAGGKPKLYRLGAFPVDPDQMGPRSEWSEPFGVTGIAFCAFYVLDQQLLKVNMPSLPLKSGKAPRELFGKVRASTATATPECSQLRETTCSQWNTLAMLHLWLSGCAAAQQERCVSM